MRRMNEDTLIPERLEYSFETQTSTKYTVHINQPITEPVYYTVISDLLDNANEGDSIIFKINSPGGRMDGLSALLDAIETTEATTIADIVGDCYSAASILALSCDECVAGSYANMLCHEVRYGVGGKGSDNLSRVQHYKKISDRLIKTAYEGFLSEAEIQDVLNGKELFLDSEEIVERLKARAEYFQEMEEVDLDSAGLTD